MSRLKIPTAEQHRAEACRWRSAAVAGLRVPSSKEHYAQVIATSQWGGGGHTRTWRRRLSWRMEKRRMRRKWPIPDENIGRGKAGGAAAEVR